MKCVACGKEHSKKDVLYTEDRLAYCVNPFTCTDEHPNSTKNILARQAAVEMYTESDLEDAIFRNLDVPEEIKSRIQKIASKPQSIRLSKPDIAYYLLMIQESKNLSSISEAVRYCVHLAMRIEPIDGTPVDSQDIPEEFNTSTEQPETVEEEEYVSPQELIKRQIEAQQAETETVEEDKFVF